MRKHIIKNEVYSNKKKICEFELKNDLNKVFNKNQKTNTKLWISGRRKKIIIEQKEIKDFAYSDNTIHYEMLEKICALLKDDNYDIRENSKLCLQLSNLPEGFIKLLIYCRIN